MKRFTIVVPVYRSQDTLEACLKSLLAQNYPDYDIVLVDSSPDESSLRIAEKYQVRVIRSTTRLWMHEARQRGINVSESDFIVFTDPDCVAAPDWLQRLDDATGLGHKLIGGAIACFPGGYWENVAHQIKFWLWQPGVPSGLYKTPPFDNLPTANMAISRDWLSSLGGINQVFTSADTLLCYQSQAAGEPPYFQSSAIVAHIHGPITLRMLVRERWRRSQDFYYMRNEFWRWPSSAVLVFLFGWPLLVARTFIWRVMHAHRTRTCCLLLTTLPWVILCDISWMLGQTLAAIRLAVRRRNR